MNWFARETIRILTFFLLTVCAVVVGLKLIKSSGNKQTYLSCLIKQERCSSAIDFQLSPLNGSALLKAAGQTNNLDVKKTHLSQALKVAPRDPSIHHALALNSLQLQDYYSAITYIDNILRFRSIEKAPYYDTLLQLAAHPTSAPEFKQYTSTMPPPEWISNLIRHASSTMTPEEIYKIAGHLPEGRDAFVTNLIKAKKVEQAFLAWNQFLPAEQLENFNWPSDPYFQDTGTNSPFGWKLHHKTTEQQENGLYSFFSGKGRILAARQITLLSQGSYTLTSKMSGHSKENGGYFKWRVYCPETNKELGSVKARNLNSAGSDYSFDFIVPEGSCRYQYIDLWGEAGEYPIISRTLIEYISLASLNLDEESS